ncbi:TetR/AcrR family transcriptional regulator [Streptomyces spiramenti]|uniref:TetR/AcrR family transcriptional regulator n=1 Tax=Streptomyces spiramenti TaxID=2720606 RepID=A0ABX1ASJ3_9ACTN|nr:TetR/AcrR family transcriptional regulator [Streptomyces spiramenti]NJP69121.1 TetR/AcrR family transcriptional regulator [Streptomyces spiramenti]
MSASHAAGVTASGGLRADAARNRDRIVAAAREVFAAEGQKAPLDEIARSAGVGNATLYRHFPTRRDLVVAVVRDVSERAADRAEEALAAGVDPFEALRGLFLAGVEEKVGVMCTMLGTADGDPGRRAAGDRLTQVVERLVLRARSTGTLRADVTAGDVLLAIGRLTRPLPDGSECRLDGDLVRRQLLIFLDGLRAPAATELPGTGPSVADLRRVPAGLS